MLLAWCVCDSPQGHFFMHLHSKKQLYFHHQPGGPAGPGLSMREPNTQRYREESLCLPHAPRHFLHLCPGRLRCPRVTAGPGQQPPSNRAPPSAAGPLSARMVPSHSPTSTPPRRHLRDGFTLPLSPPVFFLRDEQTHCPHPPAPRPPIGCDGRREPANPRRRWLPCRWGEENNNKQAGARAAEGAGPSGGSGGAAGNGPAGGVRGRGGARPGRLCWVCGGGQAAGRLAP